MRTHLLALSAGVALTAAGCGLFDSESVLPSLDTSFDVSGDAGTVTDQVVGPDGRLLTGASIGEACDGDSDCRAGLACADGGACQPTGDAPEGTPCTTSGECGEGLSCGLTAQCEPSGGLTEGEPCTDLGACGDGLRCNLVGFAGICEPEGTGDAGATCEVSGDCLAPLACGPSGICQIGVFGGLSFMPQAECEEVDDSADFQAYFEVPRGEPLSEFYRLPFPNDARVVGGQLDLTGHPDPGSRYIGGELVTRYLDAVVANFDGFSTNPAVYFRFNRSVDFGSLTGSGDDATLWFVDIDPESPEYGQRRSMYWSVTNGRGLFLCTNYVAVHPSWSSPLRHDTTYAVYMTDGIRSNDGDFPLRSDDLVAMLRDDAPADTALTNAWTAYAPLRAYIADNDNISGANIVSAAVFTTMDPDRDIPSLRDAVRAEPVPSLDNLTVCESGATSPCDGGTDDRACVSASGDFVQIHATYEAPIWQRGTRPYLEPTDGGDVFGGGAPEPQGTETMCAALTIPTGEMPEAGWPLVMYAHGTGGSFTSAIRTGVAGDVANIDLGDDRVVRFATLTIDGVQHGPRRGESDLDAETLFYNFANPRAAHGNIQQGAADYFLLTAIAEQLDLDADASPTGDPIRIDGGNLWFFGHSQGVQVGAPFAAWEPNVRGAVFSGTGGGLPEALLNKSQPIDIASAVRFVLSRGRPDVNPVSELDPVLSLLQMHVDPVDPLNYGRRFFNTRTEEEAPLHVFMSYGYGDNYTPEPVQKAFAGGANLPVAQPANGSLSGLRTVDYPVSANAGPGPERATALVVDREPNGDYDGHFVLFRIESLNDQMREFLATGVLDGTPTVSAP